MDVGPHGAVTLRDVRLGLIAEGRLAAGRAASAAPEGLQSRVDGGLRQDSFRSAAGPAGPGRTVAFRRLEVAPLLVTVELAPEDYLADWHGEMRVTIAFCAAVVLLYAVGCLLMRRVQAQHRLARQRVELLAKVFEHSGEAIMLTDHQHRVIEVNPAFVRQTGYSAEEIVGRDAAQQLAAQGPNQAQLARITEALDREGQWRGEVWDRAKDGREYPKWLSVTVLRGADGGISHHITSSIDVTEVKLAEARMQHLAHHDTLTGLPNRVHLLERLQGAIADARREGSQLAVLFIDMDRFKNINDTLGHQVGDGLLVEVGRRLRALVRETDLVARLGGDEFVVVLTHVGQRGADAAAKIGGQLLQALGRPYAVQGHELHSTPSVGISLFPADGAEPDTLMKNADTAMYHAKAQGRNNCQYFTPALNEARGERLALEVGLRGVIERNELFLHYQPQQDVASGRIVAFEALLRWRHPERGLIPPLDFIPIAEDTGLIEPIGSWVLDAALQQVAQWRRDGHAALRVAVNLSAQQLRLDSFAERVAQALTRHGLPGSALELEITESVAMRDPERTAALLRQLRHIGVALAIDDFGTGHSSLAYLKQLPLSCLKLDRSFVMDIERDANDAAICTATIQMAHSLGLGVVAEGVETAMQLEFLRRLGCDTVQGYHLSRPLPAADCGAFLARHALGDLALAH